MTDERTTSPISHKLLLIVGGLFVVDSLTAGQMRMLLGHDPTAVLSGEVWRLLTFPLISNNLHHLILTAFTLYAVFPQLESMFGVRRFYAYGAVLLLGAGFLFTAMGQYAGPAIQPGIFPFVLASLVIYVYLYPSSEMSFFGIVSLPSWLAITLLGGTAVLVDLVEMVVDPGLFGAFLAIDLFGVGTGVAFAVTAFDNSAPMQKKRKDLDGGGRNTDPDYAQVEEDDEDFSFAVRPVRRQERRADDAHSDQNDQDTFSEERLNEILDKISSRGEAALSPAERRFLRDYAERL